MKIPYYALVPLIAATLISLSPSQTTSASAAETRSGMALSHIPKTVLSDTLVGQADVTQAITLDLVLRQRNQDKIEETIRHISDPRDPMYGHYFTPTQYRDTFGPAQSDVAKVVAFAQNHGLEVVRVSPTRTYVQVQGTVGAVNAAFGVTLRNFASASTGRIYHAPDSEPTLDATVAPLLTSVAGLSNAGIPHWDSHRVVPQPGFTQYYNGNGGLSPYDTADIYKMVQALSSVSDGAGEVLGLYEEGTYTPSDIATWDNYYKYPTIPINTISVDGFNTHSAPGGAAGEFTLDIDMLQTWCFGASQIRAYECSDKLSSQTAFVVESIDTFDTMANDTTLADVISVSYGISENELPTSDIISEGEVISQLALQGQTVCVSSGDAAAFSDQKAGNNNPTVEDPGSQPFVTCVGGTDMQDTASSQPQLVSQTSWFDPNDGSRGPIGAGGGGGFSAVWGFPYYQSGSFNTSVNKQGSTQFRNTPDVSLFGSYDSQTGGYSVYVSPSGWGGENGTSAACPLWAALLADVDTIRKKNSLPDIGFANPAIYLLAESSQYSTDFYDVNDGSTNGFFKAVNGYDNSTGWGTALNGTQLVEDLATAPIFAIWDFSTNATSVTSGNTLTGTLTLPLQAPQAETFSVSSSKTSAATVPSTVVIAKGKSSATFTITAKSVTAATKVNIQAAIYGIGETIAITVNPSTSSTALSSVSLSPTTVTGGTSSTGTVTLTTAPTADTTVTLTSSDTSSATVPASVVVSAGQTTGTFTISTLSVTATKSVTISATLGSVTKTATLTVNPKATTPALESVTVSPATVTGGTSSTGTVTFTSAPPANRTVTLTSSDTSSATVPANVVMKAGQTTATFTVTTSSVTAVKSVTITAKFSTVTKTATLTVNPASGTTIKLSSVSVNPTTVTGGTSSTGTVTLTGAPTANRTVTLSSSNTGAATVPAKVVVQAGQTTATFTVTTSSVTATQTATITATLGSISKTADLTVNPAGGGNVTLSTLGLNPATVKGGNSSTGTVTLSGPAPGGNVIITLTSSRKADAAPPTSVTVLSGHTTATFNIATASVLSQTTANIGATYNGVALSKKLTITP